MASKTILLWGGEQLSLATFEGDASRQTVKRAGTLRWEEESARKTVAEAALDLRRWLSELGVPQGEPVRILLPREQTVLRKLELPDAPDDELPDLVRFQAATKSSTPIDDLALDFLPLSHDPAAAGRSAIAVTVDRQRLHRLETVAKAAGLAPETVSLSILGIARYVQAVHLSGEPLETPALILYMLPGRLEIAVFDSGSLVFNHGVRLAEGDPQKAIQILRSELNRTSVALSQMHHAAEVAHCYLLAAAPIDPSVIEFLDDRYVQRLTVIGEARIPEELRGIEALAGAALTNARGIAEVDLLHPRKKAEKPDRRRFYATVGGGLSTLLLLSGFLLIRTWISSAEARIAELNRDRYRLENELNEGAPRRDYHAALSGWKQGQADTISQLKTLVDQLPGTERLYFRELKVEALAGESVARITGQIHARSQKDINDFFALLSDNGHKPQPPKFKTQIVDPDYPSESEFNVEFARQQIPIRSPVARETGASATTPPG